MKATGIVRRIDARGIITQKSWKPHKHWFFRWFCPKIFEKTGGFRLFSFLKNGVLKYIIRSRMNKCVHPASSIFAVTQIDFIKRFCPKTVDICPNIVYTIF